GIDISHHKSQHVDEFKNEHFDIVITVCDHAENVCPVIPNATETVHIPFFDPIAATGTPEEILAEYRRVRDQIRKEIGAFLREKLRNITNNHIT
ncbi:arsenate reductase ArsC, partial [bacterium]|nr:arsenate reductase ArsC [bacterium]MBU1024634.1 arsenate reductase ArsC [bacterium]